MGDCSSPRGLRGGLPQSDKRNSDNEIGDFALAAHLEPEILLVHEVLAVGEATFQKKCLGKLGDVNWGEY